MTARVLLAQDARTVVETLGDEKVLFAVPGESLHYLNQTASIVWDCLADPVTRDDLVAEISEAFGVAGSTVGLDVDAVLIPLLKAGAVCSISEDGVQRGQ